MDPNPADSNVKISQSPLARQGGSFVLRTHIVSQFLSSIIGPLLGVYFIYITTNLPPKSLNQFLVSVLVTTLLVDIVHFIYAVLITRNARLYLDHIFKDKPLQAGSDELKAWNEIVPLPRRSAVAQFVLIYVIIVAPVVLFMRFVGGLSVPQLVYLSIGGSLAAIVVLILNFLYLDTQLAPARNILLPSDPSRQEIQITVGQSARQYFVIVVILLMGTFVIGGISFQIVTALSAPGADLHAVINYYRTQIIIMGVAIFIIGILLAFQLARAVARPTREIIRTMEDIRKGNFGERAEITTSDDMARLTIRFNQMMGQLEEAHSSLEKQVQERTLSLEQRSRQLQAAAQVAREAASLQDLGSMLSRTVNLISEQFGFYHAGIFLIDDAREFAVLRAASSEGGQKMLARGHRLLVGQQGIVGAAAFLNIPRIVLDVGVNTEFLINPDLPETRSEVAIPLTVQGQVIGVLDIQSTEVSKFSPADIEVLQILADQVALAIQNARLFSESQEAIQRLESLSGENVGRIWKERSHKQKSAYRYTSSGLLPVSRQLEPKKSSIKDPGFLRIPINLRGQKIGTISLHRSAEIPWSDADRSLADEVSMQIGLALENARLVQDSQSRAEREQVLSQLTARIRESLDLDVVMQTAVREIKQTFNLEQAEIRLQLDENPADNSNRGNHDSD